MTLVNSINGMSVGSSRNLLVGTLATSGVLAGASMGSIVPPKNIEHISGSSAMDPFEDQLEFFGAKAGGLIGDLAGAVTTGITGAAESVADQASDFGDGLVDLGKDIAGSVLDLLG